MKRAHFNHRVSAYFRQGCSDFLTSLLSAISLKYYRFIYLNFLILFKLVSLAIF